MAKSEKDKLRAAHTSFDEIKDLSKIEKHFTLVLERIPKGTLLETHFPIKEGTFTSIKNNVFNSKYCFFIFSVEDKIEEREVIVEETIPIGSKIGESSSRLLSARRGLLRNRHKVDGD